ncbi:MAG: F0F1 ATP synthase subunit B family protein [Sulfuricella sp.]
MLIDWFTVIAQVVNFLILVWLLKRFLYRPILNAIDAREKRIALALADADAKKAEAQQERDAFQHKNEVFDQQRAALLSQAADAAKAERLRLLDAARQESDGLRAKRQEALRSEQQSLSEALTRRAREEVFAIARKALADLAGTTLEERMADVFLRRLRELDDAGMAGLKSAFKAMSSPLLVRSAFVLPPPHRATIETALKETLGRETQVQFETAPDLVSGIEISTNGHKVAWSIADYLASLGKGVDELLKTQPKPEARAEQSANEHGT